MSPLVHCATLAAMDGAVFATLLDELRVRHAATTPGLVALRAQQERVAHREGDHWWLHVAVVFAADVPPSDEPLEDAHWRLARDVQQLAMRWGHCWPVLHRHTLADLPPGYVEAVPGTVIPAPPPPAVIYREPVARPPSTPTPAPDPAPAVPPKPSTQRALF
jgi:hypothetical protein